MAHAQQDRHVDRFRPCLLPQVLQQRQGLALGVEDRRAMLQPRDPKSTCPREVLEPIQTEVAQVEQRQRPGRGDLLGDRVGSVAGAPGGDSQLEDRAGEEVPQQVDLHRGQPPRKMPPQPGNWSASSSGSAMVLLSPMRTLVNLFSRSTV